MSSTAPRPDTEPEPSTRYSLRDLGLQSGQGRREELDVVVRPYRQAGADYRTREPAAAALFDLSVMQSGYAFRLRMEPVFIGPCSRCLEEARMTIHVDSHEVHDPAANDPELVSDFVHDTDDLDLTEWSQDAIGLEFPVKVLCRTDCAGLCPHCGTNWNEASCDCEPPTGDSRWDALKGLTFEE